MGLNRREFVAGAGAAGLAASPLRKLGACLPSEERRASAPDLSLLFGQPAKIWTEALPHGNGRLGAMVFGEVETERIQLNEATLWTGGPHDYVDATARESLDEIRQLIFEERVREADAVAAKMLGRPAELQAYQPFCDLFLSFPKGSDASNYRRSLDLTEAISYVGYERDGVRYRREFFSSFPDQIMVLHLLAEGAKQSCQISLSSVHDHVNVVADGQNGLLLTGQMGSTKPPQGSYIANWDGPGLRFAARIRVLSDGLVSSSGGTLTLSQASRAMLLITGATSFINFGNITGNPVAKSSEVLDRAASLSYEDLRSRHVRDYQSLFGRVSVVLGNSKQSTSFTDQRIRTFAADSDPSFAALFYQFGRYMLIASSRTGGEPANLQGIWNQERWPNWGSKWTVNINLEMNYWPAETGNLAECIDPLFSLIEDLRVTGGEVARVEYGCRGFVLHHNADLWRAATPTDGPWGMWPVGGAWLTRALWERYEYSGDTQFLRQRAYPSLRDAALFMLDFLVEIPKGLPFAGCLATNPSSSPENAFLLPDGVKGRLTYAPTMDIEIIGELFDHCIQAAEILGTDQKLAEELKRARQRLPPLQISKEGRLQEWIKDYTETEPQHRHLSHLYGVYPGDSISREKTPALMNAARNSLIRRGMDNGPASWMKAWRMALWARFGDGSRAHEQLKTLISNATSPDMLNDAALQVDGHLGGPAAIAEMLLQSQNSEIVLLPALPEAWPEGSVRGFRARGGVEIDFQWTKGELTGAVIRSSQAGRLRIRYREKQRDIRSRAGATLSFNRDLEIQH